MTRPKDSRAALFGKNDNFLGFVDKKPEETFEQFQERLNNSDRQVFFSEDMGNFLAERLYSAMALLGGYLKERDETYTDEEVLEIVPRLIEINLRSTEKN